MLVETVSPLIKNSILQKLSGKQQHRVISNKRSHEALEALQWISCLWNFLIILSLCIYFFFILFTPFSLIPFLFLFLSFFPLPSPPPLLCHHRPHCLLQMKTTERTQLISLYS